MSGATAKPGLPVELMHAKRHIVAAHSDWQAGKFEMAAMHLREALCDTAWSLYALGVERPPP